MIVSFLVVVGPTQAIVSLMVPTSDTRLFTLGTALIFLLFSYLIGFIMGQLWITSLGKATEKSEREVDRECRAQCLAEHNKLQVALSMSPLALNASDLPRTFAMHDHLRLIAGAEAQRLSQ